MIRTKYDPTLKYMANVVDFGGHSNNEIQRAVLPRTESGYRHKLLFSTSKSQPRQQRNKSLNYASIPSFGKLYLEAVIPPDIRTCRAFLEWVVREMDGRIEDR